MMMSVSRWFHTDIASSIVYHMHTSLPAEINMCGTRLQICAVACDSMSKKQHDGVLLQRNRELSGDSACLAGQLESLCIPAGRSSDQRRSA